MIIDEQKYLDLFLGPIERCKRYKPKFGDGASENGVSLDAFKIMYGADPFYSWIGLDSEFMYAAHKAAGGMTSIYRQIGVSCELLFRAIIKDTTEYEDPKLAHWSYVAKTSDGKSKVLSLDARLELSEIRNLGVKERVSAWLTDYCNELLIQQIPQHGIVFEVRQGYKSKDSKRQNADIDNATVAWANGYLPIFAIFSGQIDGDLVLRYRNNRCGIMVGSLSQNPMISLFAFTHQVLGYDLASFFQRNSAQIKIQIEDVLKILLDAN